MTKFQCIHSSGTNVIINQGVHGWRVQINLREPTQAPMTISGYVAPTLESAKELAERKSSDTVMSAMDHAEDGSRFSVLVCLDTFLTILLSSRRNTVERWLPACPCSDRSLHQLCSSVLAYAVNPQPRRFC